MTVRFELTENDYMAYARYHFRNSPDGRASSRRMVIYGIAGVLLFAFATKDDPQFGLQHPQAYAMRLGQVVLLAGAMMYVYLGLLRPYMMRAVLKSSMRKVLGTTEITLTEEAVRVANAEGQGRLKWRDCQGVLEEGDYYFILIGPLRAFVVPKRAFGSPEEAVQFHDEARGRFLAAQPAAQ